MLDEILSDHLVPSAGFKPRVSMFKSPMFYRLSYLGRHSTVFVIAEIFLQISSFGHFECMLFTDCVCP